jgi:hypothetical protein
MNSACEGCGKCGRDLYEDIDPRQDDREIDPGDAACNREYDMRAEIIQQKEEYNKSLFESAQKHFHQHEQCRIRRMIRRDKTPFKPNNYLLAGSISFSVGW